MADLKKFEGLSRFAASEGWRITLLKMPASKKALNRLLDFWKPDGIVINIENDGAFVGNIPSIIMGMPPKRYRGNSRFVTNDAEATASLAAKTLISLGYPHFAFVGAPQGEEWSPARHQAFENILKMHERPCLAFTPSNQDAASILSLQKRLRKWLKELPKPCALFAANDSIGQAVLDAAAATGIRIPRDLAVCSVDNDEQICLSTTPTLSSIEPDYFRGGFLAGTLFKEIFSHPQKNIPRTPILFGPVTLHRRGSLRARTYHDKTVNDAIDYIHENFSRCINVTDVIKLFPCTRRMAEIRFKRATGHAILEEILATRIEFAKSLIHRPGLSLDDIATLSGWKTYGVFRKYFLKATGMTPRKARKNICHEAHA